MIDHLVVGLALPAEYADAGGHLSAAALAQRFLVRGEEGRIDAAQQFAGRAVAALRRVRAVQTQPDGPAVVFAVYASLPAEEAAPAAVLGLDLREPREHVFMQNELAAPAVGCLKATPQDQGIGLSAVGQLRDLLAVVEERYEALTSQFGRRHHRQIIVASQGGRRCGQEGRARPPSGKQGRREK